MHWRELRDDAPVVVTLATLGVVLACAVTAAGPRYLAGWGWMAAVLLGLLISATNPVSVIATFKEAGVTGRRRLLVEARASPTTARWRCFTSWRWRRRLAATSVSRVPWAASSSQSWAG